MSSYTNSNISIGKIREANSDSFISSNNLILYEELRLIERNESEINVVWKGAHMVLFFMAFVFGSFCTCCFHILMHMFDEKCVLFPKMSSHSSIRQIVYEFFSIKTELVENEPERPTDYVTTQWADNSVCYLPTYVPLVSGLAGLVWTTMFLMCSSGTSTVTGAQRHWRALPLMFIFSVAMSVLCIYASAVTHSGLRELCHRLSEVTGNSRCTYTINVVTLAYERRIRGVFQATRLSIVSAWLHTACWILSSLVIVARVLLAVDFTLVHVRAQLIGNMDDMLQKYEKQIDSINAEEPATPLRSAIDEDDSEVELYAQSQIQFKMTDPNTLDMVKKPSQELSEVSLVPEEETRLKYDYIKDLINKLVNNVSNPDPKSLENSDTLLSVAGDGNKSQIKIGDSVQESIDSENAEKIAKEFMQKLHGQLAQEFTEFEHQVKSSLKDAGKEVDPIGETDKKDKTINEDTKDVETNDKDERDTKTKDVRKHVQLNISDNPDSVRKAPQEDTKMDKYEPEHEEKGSEKTEKQDASHEKTVSTPYKRTGNQDDYEPENKYEIAEEKLDKSILQENAEVKETTSKNIQRNISDDKTAPGNRKTGKNQQMDKKNNVTNDEDDKADDHDKNDRKDTDSHNKNP